MSSEIAQPAVQESAAPGLDAAVRTATGVRYPRGAVWRKWDLHVHAPGAKLSDNYAKREGALDWDRFCREVEESDVAAVGITDYFSFASFFAFTTAHRERYPESSKVFFPNLELRLNEAVNSEAEEVHLHLIFPPSLTQAEAEKFLRALPTEIRVENDRALPCFELDSATHYGSATVTRANIRAAIRATFGDKAISQDHLLVVTSCKNDGIRPESGRLRKENLTDEIDKFSDGFFGNSGSRDYFLTTDRFEDSTQKSRAKPVFGGCDAHRFEDLAEWLGRSIDTEHQRKEVTWVKADLTFDGLRQTLIEPEHRVALQPQQPDLKEPYKYIARVRFTGSDFPDEIVLNPNLVSIIGSRSSGKSALLAYIAHAVDSTYTVAQQVAAGIADDAAHAGPAAGYTWEGTRDVGCSVVWGDENVTSGKIIYIPQNSLFAISSRPDEITSKIRPALFRADPAFAATYRQLEGDIDTCNGQIREAVEAWFQLGSDRAALQEELRDLGDKEAVATTLAALQETIAALRASSSLTAEEITQYQDVSNQLRAAQARLDELREIDNSVSPYYEDSRAGGRSVGDQVGVDVTITPLPNLLPDELATRLTALAEQSRTAVLAQVRGAFTTFLAGVDAERVELGQTLQRLQDDNAALIAKNRANSELDQQVKHAERQQAALDKIAKQEDRIARNIERATAQVTAIRAALDKRQADFDELRTAFESAPRNLEQITFQMEIEVEESVIVGLSDGFNKQATSTYVDGLSQVVKYAEAQQDPAAFLTYLGEGRQKIKQGRIQSGVAVDVLTATAGIRFAATLEDDKIGGFARSSMTPGKQALFALTLILNESEEEWPLLIDQPEDDLDSRSIYRSIVPYLTDRKCQRQILMVSHNPNLVIGADSEQLIIANRHGGDCKNAGGKMFDYLGGSLEHGFAETETDCVLDRCGVREHACALLDGGEEAFQRRKQKYNI